MLRILLTAALVIVLLFRKGTHAAEPVCETIPPPIVSDPAFAAQQILLRTVDRAPSHGPANLSVQSVTGDRWVVVHTSENWESPNGPSLPRSTTIFAVVPKTGSLRCLVVPNGHAFEYGFEPGASCGPHAVVFYLRRFELEPLPPNLWQRSAWRWDLETGAVTPLLNDVPRGVVADYIGLARAADHFQFHVTWTDSAARKWTGTMLLQPLPALGPRPPQSVRVDGSAGYRFINCPNRSVVTSERPRPEDPVQLRCLSIDDMTKTVWTTTREDFAPRMNMAPRSYTSISSTAWKRRQPA